MSNKGLLQSVFRGKNSEGNPIERIGDLSGLGSIIGIIAALLGLMIGLPLVPLTSVPWEVTSTLPFVWVLGNNYNYGIYVAGFMALLGMGLFLQSYGSKKMRARVGSMLGSSFLLAFIFSIVTAGYAIIGFNEVSLISNLFSFLSLFYFFGMLFVLAWQVVSVYYIDTSVTWVGFLAGILNGLFIPLLALGQVLGAALVYGAYITLAIGQFMTLIYWWSPYSTIREYARSPEKAKFAFGLSGVLTFIIGTAAVYIGPLEIIEGENSIQIWKPWSTISEVPTTFVTDPALVYALLASMLFWIMLAPRLGAKELKAAAIGEDIIKGGSKYFALFLIILGLIAAGQAGTFSTGVASWGFFLVMGVAGTMVLIGAMYTTKTDIIVGFPLIIAGILTMIHPFSISTFILFAWILIILTQIFLMTECYIRGLTGFSQGALTVIVSILMSALIIVFMLGGFGSGPLALWPTSNWFNISLIPGIPSAIQSSLVIILPFLILVLRNTALSGFSHGRGYTTGGILLGITVIFTLMVPIIAGNATITHEANTGAALLLGLYAISLVLLLNLNLNLANDVLNKNYDFEGTLIKFSTIGQLIFGAFIAIIVLFYFSGLPEPSEIAFVLSLLVSFVVGSEILSILSWFIAGFRLGMLKQGFRFSRISKVIEATN